MEDEKEVAVPETATEVTPEVTAEETAAESTAETVEKEEVDWKARAEKAEADYKAQKIRAEKAEKKVKAPIEQKGETKDLTSKDTMALIRAQVHEDDMDEVIDYAKFKGVTVSDALKSSVVKTLLSQKSEQRTTAEATNTGKNRGTTSKTSVESLLEKARKTGELPDRDEDLSAMLDKRYTPKTK